MALKKRWVDPAQGAELAKGTRVGYGESQTGNNHHLMSRKHFIEDPDGVLEEIIPLSTAIYQNNSHRGHPLHFLNSDLFKFLASDKATNDARKDLVHPFLTTRMDYRNYSPFTVSIVNSKTGRVVDSLSLTLLIPPRSMQISNNHEISTTMTTLGPVTIAHLPDPLNISVSGKSAAFITSMDGLANYRSRKISAGFLNLHALTSLFRSNGAARMSYVQLFGKQAGSALNIPGANDMTSPIISIVDQVKISYDGTSYLGHFTNFSFSESAQTPYNFDFQFEFIATGLEGDTVEGHIEHSFLGVQRIVVDQEDAQRLKGIAVTGYDNNTFDSGLMGFTPGPMEPQIQGSDVGAGEAVFDPAYPMPGPAGTPLEAVNRANAHVAANISHNKYLLGGAGSPGKAVDCSGMVWSCIPELSSVKVRARNMYSPAQIEGVSSAVTNLPWQNPTRLEVGDLILWAYNKPYTPENIVHVGLVTAVFSKSEVQSLKDSGKLLQRPDTDKGYHDDVMRSQVKEICMSTGVNNGDYGPKKVSITLGESGYWLGKDFMVVFSRPNAFLGQNRITPIGLT